MKTKIVISFAAAYLFIFTILCATTTSAFVCAYIYLFSPIVTAVMVYLVLTEKGYNGSESAKKEEWGYSGKNKNERGVFDAIPGKTKSYS
jgi:hypothetical protein